MNDIGKIIETRPILQKHIEETGCATCAKVCEYLDCHIGEIYAAFDNANNIHMGVMCKIKSDIFLNGTLSAFNKNDRICDTGSTIGYNGRSIVCLDDYKYIMRLH